MLISAFESKETSCKFVRYPSSFNSILSTSKNDPWITMFLIFKRGVDLEVCVDSFKSKQNSTLTNLCLEYFSNAVQFFFFLKLNSNHNHKNIFISIYSQC